MIVIKILSKFADTYEVLFDDGFVKILKGHRMSKANAESMQSSPLFHPVKGTKQERRDKKRKLNVAALFSKKPNVSPTPKKKRTSSQRKVAPPSTPSAPELAQDSSSPAVDDNEKYLPRLVLNRISC